MRWNELGFRVPGRELSVSSAVGDVVGSTGAGRRQVASAGACAGAVRFVGDVSRDRGGRFRCAAECRASSAGAPKAAPAERAGQGGRRGGRATLRWRCGPRRHGAHGSVLVMSREPRLRTAAMRGSQLPGRSVRDERRPRAERPAPTGRRSRLDGHPGTEPGSRGRTRRTILCSGPSPLAVKIQVSLAGRAPAPVPSRRRPRPGRPTDASVPVAGGAGLCDGGCGRAG